jgi:hypothetical protein
MLEIARVAFYCLLIQSLSDTLAERNLPVAIVIVRMKTWSAHVAILPMRRRTRRRTRKKGAQ